MPILVNQQPGASNMALLDRSFTLSLHSAIARTTRKDLIEKEQHEQMEYAQQRIRQKKRLYNHFVLFLIGSVFLILLNKVFKYGAEYDWFKWAILFWAFLFAVHLFNVFVTHRFMGRDWERDQREKLVQKQQKRIAEIEQEIQATITPDISPKKKSE